MTNNVPKDYLKEVWWSEGYTNCHEVHNGYLLAEYECNDGMKYIVTLGTHLTTVIRHINKYYYNEQDAYASIADLSEC